MKRTGMLLVLLCAMAVNASGADLRAASRADRPDGSNGGSAFPVVAADQSRPRPVSSNLVDDPGEDDGTGGYSTTVCNCRRECSLNGYSCKITTDSFKACRITTSGTCQSCQKDCG
ncbi:MAG TPA: hypothetical protein VF911_21005 [Thermoanaerobaculia bacterium]|jgi:hypothetical protein